MTISVTTRSGKGSPLTQSEMDTNLTNLARDATTTQQGNVRLATDAETTTGTSDTLAVTPASLAAQGYVTESGASANVFESGELAISLGAEVSAAHGLGQVPSEVDAYLICKVTEGGYAVGDRVKMSGWYGNTGGGSIEQTGVLSVADATNVIGVVGTDGIEIYERSPSPGTRFQIVEANWRIVLRARK